MKRSIGHFLLATLIVVIGIGGLLGYQFYMIPYVFSEEVIKVRTANAVLPKNHILTQADLYVDKVAKEHLPAMYITDMALAEGKKLKVDLANGMMLTEQLIDLNDIEPGEGEGLFTIPKEKIFAINGTLRAGDKVNLYLIQTDAQKNRSGNADDLAEAIAQRAFIENAKVAFVRTEDNNDVRDDDKGNVNNRMTSTGKIATPELKITTQQGEELATYFEQGFSVWVVRVE